MLRREDSRMLKRQLKQLRSLRDRLRKRRMMKSLPTTDNKLETNKKKRNIKLPVGESMESIKTERKLLELLWMQLLKLKKIHRQRLMLLGLLKLLTTINQTTPKTKKNKLPKTPPKPKNQKKSKIKPQLNFKAPKRKQKIFNQP